MQEYIFKHTNGRRCCLFCGSDSVVVSSLFVVAPIMCWYFCLVLVWWYSCFLSSLTIISLRKRVLVALIMLFLCGCLSLFLCFLLGLWSVIIAFPYHIFPIVTYRPFAQLHIIFLISQPKQMIKHMHKKKIQNFTLKIFVCVDAICLSQQFFSNVGTFFPFFLCWTSTEQRIRCLAQGHNTLPLVSL